MSRVLSRGVRTLWLDKLANILVVVLLMEMMVAAGLGVCLSDLAAVARNVPLLIRAGLANYVLVPAIAISLLYLFQASPIVALGFLLVSVCPGAPFAPALTAIAKGQVAVSVGLMVILAASSAVVAPLLLSSLSRLITHGANLKIDTVKIVTTLLMTQFIPLGIGLLIRAKRPLIAEKLKKPANLLSAVLSLLVFALIIALQYRTLVEVRAKGYLEICILIFLFLAAGLVLGGQPIALCKAIGLTTAARNVGVALVIATASFPDTAAVTAVIVFAIFQTMILVLFALLLARVSATLQSLRRAFETTI
jgi:BASS family bile acid:Na+ symporter